MNFSHFYEKYNISEFVAFPKGEEVTLSGQKYYKSASLNEKVKKVIMKYADADVRDILVKCVEDEIITPVFLDKDIPQYIINFIREKHRRHQLGRAYRLEQKGYVFINPKLFFMDEKLVYDIIIHESMHLAEYKNSSRYYTINYLYMTKFYKFFFSSLFSLKNDSCIEDKHLIKLVENIRGIAKKKSVNFHSIYTPFFETFEKCTKLSEEEFGKIAREFMHFIVGAFEDFEIALRLPKWMYETANIAYSKLSSGDVINTFYCQEFWTPTEVVAIISEMNPNKKNIKETIKLIKV